MYSIEFNEHRQVLRFVGSGRLTGHEIIGAKQALLTTEDQVRLVHAFLVNLANVDALEISGDEMRQIIGLDVQLSALAPHAAVAIVAPRDHVFGLARMWEAYADTVGWVTAVFRSPAEANAWLEQRRSPAGQDSSPTAT